jgi:hypothetical protein
MSIFKTPSPEMSMSPELRQSSDATMFGVDPMPMRPAGNVKVAQSYDEAQMLLRTAAGGDYGARSVEHVARPRYGHKV